jgi:arylsulfatase
VNGVPQTPLPGVSMRYSFDDAAAPTTKQVQYFEMMGTRGIWRDGWKAVTEHGAISGMGHFEDDRWQLFHTDVDRAEARDLAGEYPDKAKELADLWLEEAQKYDVLPLDDRTPAELAAAMPEAVLPPRGIYVYYPDTLDVPDFAAANTRGRSFKILAEVEIGDGAAQGVLFAHGSRFGGHTLFVKDRRLWYAHNFIGIPPEQQLVSDREIEAGAHVLGVEFQKKGTGEHGASYGTARLYVDEQVVAESELLTQYGHFALAGEGLSIGRDSGDAVSKEYTPEFPFTGGHIVKVEVSVGDDAYVDLERQFAAAIARD